MVKARLLLRIKESQLTRRDAIRGMNMSKQMLLYARTNNQGSTCSTDIGYTESEWAKLSENERQEIIAEYTGDVVDLWVQPED